MEFKKGERIKLEGGKVAVVKENSAKADKALSTRWKPTESRMR